MFCIDDEKKLKRKIIGFIILFLEDSKLRFLDVVRLIIKLRYWFFIIVIGNLWKNVGVV